MPAKTIDEVIHQLDKIIEWSYQSKSRLGYFPALYRKVTLKVKEGINGGFFENGERMEQLDVIFANRYLEAYTKFQKGDKPSASWQVTFDSTNQFWPIVLQHLLLGMNAHINLDLGIAAAQINPGQSINELKDDFNKINGILISLVDETQKKLSQVWPMLKTLDWAAGKLDEGIVRFSIEKARDQAWRVATELAPLNKKKQEDYIYKLDLDVSSLGNLIRKPGIIFGFLTKLIRMSEMKSVSKIINVLN